MKPNASKLLVSQILHNVIQVFLEPARKHSDQFTAARISRCNLHLPTRYNLHLLKQSTEQTCIRTNALHKPLANSLAGDVGPGGVPGLTPICTVNSNNWS